MQRYRNIVSSFSRHGFSFVVKELGLHEFLSLPKHLFTEDEQDVYLKPIAERIRMFLEEMGPTFVKMGQFASTRPDLLPANIILELEKLQNQVPPFPSEIAKKIIEQELEDSIENLFAEFREEPLAAASIGQVHYAVLHTGEPVAIKVQRPNIRKLIKTDLEILQDLAPLVEQRIKNAAKYQLTDLVDEFAKSLQAELDYTIEARNGERIGRQFQNNPAIRVPKIYWDYTTQKVLTMEYVEGIKINQKEILVQNGVDCKSLARRVARALLHQIFKEGFFHGDPHPGNILVLPKDTIIFMDFGMVGRLTPEMRIHFSSLLIALMKKDTDRLIKAIMNIGIMPDEINKDQLKKDVELLKEKYYDTPLSKVNLGQAVNDLFSVAFEHQIKIPSDLTLLGKAILTVEGIVEELDPELSIIHVAEPFSRELLKDRYNPKRMVKTIVNDLSEYGELLSTLPKHINELASVIKKGKLHMEINVPEVGKAIQKLERISNRLSFSIVLLSFSIIMAALIIGSALTRQSTLLWNVPAIEIGSIIATLMFLWLIFSIFKSGRF